MNFTRKHRPKDFEHFYGNKSTVNSIISLLKKDAEDIPKAWLFTGESGCGKTTAGRIIANMIGCDPSAFYEYNTANTRGIETIRKVVSSSQFRPIKGNYKVYLFDEAHQITGVAAEALLKLIEDPPKDTYFIFATTNPEALKKTLKSRCVTYHFPTITSRDMKALLNDICSEEDDDDFPKDVIDKIIEVSEGKPRMAVQLLDMVFEMEDIDEMLEVIETAEVHSEADVKDICQALMQNRSWKEVASLLKGTNNDPESLRRGILGFFNAVLINSGDTRIAQLMECFENNYYDTGKAGLTMSCMQALEI